MPIKILGKLSDSENKNVIKIEGKNINNIIITKYTPNDKKYWRFKQISSVVEIDLR